MARAYTVVKYVWHDTSGYSGQINMLSSTLISRYMPRYGLYGCIVQTSVTRATVIKHTTIRIASDKVFVFVALLRKFSTLNRCVVCPLYV